VEYYEGLQQLMSMFVVTSVMAGVNKIAQVSRWVKNRFSQSSCSIQGGRRRRRNTKRRNTKRRHTKRRHLTKIKSHRKKTYRR